VATHIIRLARANDLSLIQALVTQASPSLTESTDQAQLEAGQSSSLLWVSQAPATEVAGFLLAQISDQTLHIVQLNVSAIFARLGIGSELLAHLFKQANKLGFRYITATTPAHLPSTSRFYLKNGYEIVVDTSMFPHLAGSDKVFLCKNLLS
jgi:ribosomal protein S18 acetylase RimI-like enzyme